jgi:hypothetical protein
MCEKKYNMVANIITNQVFNSIPKTFGSTLNGYDKLTDKHYEDGFRDLVIPELEANEKITDWYYDEDVDMCFYNKTKMTEAEIDATIPNYISKLNFKIGLLTNHGITNAQVQAFFDSLEDVILREKLQLLWFESSFFERKDTNLVNFAPALGLTTEDLNSIFINFNGYD